MYSDLNQEQESSVTDSSSPNNKLLQFRGEWRNRLYLLMQF